MQIYFKSLIAPNMLLCQKNKKIKNRNPYSTRWPLKNNKPCYTSAKKNTTTKYLKTTKKKDFFFLAEKMKECPVGKKQKQILMKKGERIYILLMEKNLVMKMLPHVRSMMYYF